MSMGFWSVFIAREPVSHLLTGQSMYTFSAGSGRRTGQISFLIWDGKGTGHAAWEGSGTLQWSHSDSDRGPVTLCSGNIGPLSLSCSLSLEHTTLLSSTCCLVACPFILFTSWPHHTACGI